MQDDSQSLKVGVSMTKEEKEIFDKWTKEQIYEAYLLEVEHSKQLNIEVSRLRRQIAEVRFSVR